MNPVTPTDLFGGPDPISVLTWWAAHPGAEPDGLEDDTVLVDRQGSGADITTLPDLTKYSHVTVVLICAPAARYVVQFATSKQPAWGWTGGDSCGGPEVAAYTSGEIDHRTPPREVYVLVPGTTRYDLTILGRPIGQAVRNPR